jgi:hypothetical protein
LRKKRFAWLQNWREVQARDKIICLVDGDGVINGLQIMSAEHALVNGRYFRIAALP